MLDHFLIYHAIDIETQKLFKFRVPQFLYELPHFLYEVFVSLYVAVEIYLFKMVNCLKATNVENGKMP